MGGVFTMRQEQINPAMSWRVAAPADADATLGLMREFYREEALDFDAARQGSALRALLADPALGAVFLLGVSSGAVAPAGHMVLTWACSLEFGGRFALLDELFIRPEARGLDRGRRALDIAVEWARENGACAFRLEVARGNARARSLYAGRGLVAQDRDLMTLRLA